MPELDSLIAQMLAARGYAIDDPVVREGDDRDVVADYVAAHEVTGRSSWAKRSIPITSRPQSRNYRELYEFLIEDRGAP